jgi:hypothetical protein
MSIGGIGSSGSISFWQQDQNYWSQQKSDAQSTAAETSLVSAMATAEASRETGLSSIANKAALTRVNNQIAADEKALYASSGSSTSGSSSASTPSSPYATAVGKVPLTTSTPLSTLGIPPGGTISVSDGTKITAYSATGTDTVGNLISTVNANVAGDAYVTASLNGQGKLTFTAKNAANTITVGGTFASDVGFGVGNTTFTPPPVSASSTSAASSTTVSASSTASSAGTSTSSSKSTAGIVSAATLNATAAASLLTQSGVNGTLVNMLA